MKRKVILDIVMGIFMICLMNLSFTGIELHEILGIGVFFLFLFHKILNFKWIKSITMNLLKKGIKTKIKIMYIIDILLLILVILNVMTGILISTHILTNITTSDIGMTSNWHHFFAYWLAIVLLIHIGLHWELIRNAVKIKKDSFIEKIVLGIITVVIIVVLFKSNIIKKLMIPKKEISLQYETENIESTQNNALQRDDEKQENGKTQNHILQDNDVKQENEDTKNSISQKDNDDNEEQEDENTQNNTSMVIERPTIEEYLSKLFCTGCSRHCPLTNPSCVRGLNRQTQEVQEYNQIYGTNETYTSSRKNQR